MKKLLTIAALIMCGHFAQAQYTMAFRMNDFDYLWAPTSLNNGATWNEGTSFPIFLPFSFEIFGQSYSAVNVMAGGGVNFPGVGMKELFVFHTPFGGYYLHDKGNGASQINYLVDGDPGEHVLKIEWINAGFLQFASTSDPTDFVDFQVWIFEVDNHIEVRFGNSQTDPGTYGYPELQSDSNPGTSFKFWFDSCDDVLCPTGPASLPSYGIYTMCSPNYYFVDGTPANGIIYNICPGTCPDYLSTPEELTAERVAIYPNPSRDYLNVAFPEEQANMEVTLFDLAGNVLQKQMFSGKEHTIERGDLSPGAYLLQLKSEKGETLMKKIVVE